MNVGSHELSVRTSRSITRGDFADALLLRVTILRHRYHRSQPLSAALSRIEFFSVEHNRTGGDTWLFNSFRPPPISSFNRSLNPASFVCSSDTSFLREKMSVLSRSSLGHGDLRSPIWFAPQRLFLSTLRENVWSNRFLVGIWINGERKRFVIDGTEKFGEFIGPD